MFVCVFIFLQVDRLVIGGGMVFTFLKARGLSVGSSLVEDDKLDLVSNVLQEVSIRYHSTRGSRKISTRYPQFSRKVSQRYPKGMLLSIVSSILFVCLAWCSIIDFAAGKVGPKILEVPLCRCWLHVFGSRFSFVVFLCASRVMLDCRRCAPVTASRYYYLILIVILDPKKMEPPLVPYHCWLYSVGYRLHHVLLIAGSSPLALDFCVF